MEKLYGWYSLNAYNEGKTEYIYTNTFNQETFCTITLTEKNVLIKKKNIKMLFIPVN